MTDDLTKRWDRPEFAAAGAWREMDEFLTGLRPPQTAEDQAKASAEFLEIQKRCNDRVMQIFEKASAGKDAPHLSLVPTKGGLSAP